MNNSNKIMPIEFFGSHTNPEDWDNYIYQFPTLKEIETKLNEYDKQKEDNALLLDALKMYLEIENNSHGLMPVLLRPFTRKAKEAINKASK